VKSAHDCSDGGLAVALAESCITGNIGAKLELPDTVEFEANTRLDAVLFGETQSRIVISTQPEHLPRLQELARAAGVPLSYLGLVGGERLMISDNRAAALRPIVEAPLSTLSDAYRGAIGRLMS
jgi:phosphoribosylformylglycinamidine synthase